MLMKCRPTIRSIVKVLKFSHQKTEKLPQSTKILFILLIGSLFFNAKTTNSIEPQVIQKIVRDSIFITNEKVKVEVVEATTLLPLERIVENFKIKSKKETKKSIYKEWMWYLKAREGFIDHVYVCPAGYRTIGYGHNIDAHGWSRVKKYMKGNKITYEGATKLLQEDIQIHYELVCNLLPNLDKNQHLAVTALVMNCGLAKVMYSGGKKSNGYSGFWQSCLNGNVPAFYKYNGYRSKGMWKTSPNLKQARIFETALFKGEIQKVMLMAQKYQNCLIKRDILPAKEKGILK